MVNQHCGKRLISTVGSGKAVNQHCGMWLISTVVSGKSALLEVACFKPHLHIHDFLYDSPRFTPISHGQKNRGGPG